MNPRLFDADCDLRLKYAGVYVLGNPYCVDGLYDYEIPCEMGNGAVVPGSFVTVPFGIRNQTRVALVAEVRETSQYKELKMIRMRCPDSISLDAEMLGLCEFLRNRIFCTTEEAVRAMVPASSILRLREIYAPVPNTAPPASDDIRASDLSVYEYIRARGEASLPALREKFAVQVEGSLRRLVSLGYLSKRVEQEREKAEKTELHWSLACTRRMAEELSEGRACENLPALRSQKHRDVLKVLLGEDAPMGNAALCLAANVSGTQLKALRDKGLIEAEEVRIDRNPYAEIPYVGRIERKLNAEQSAALETVAGLAFSGEPKAALLHGVTGSGKTSVMVALIDRLIDAGRGVILLLPEIALTPQSVAIFCSRYGNRVAVIHSALTAGERYDAYCRIRSGGADIVIGTRSAVFAPVRNLGAIIIDEEQEHTYKSDQDPKYHARDIARYRCNYHKALMLLASATPALESYKKAMDGVYTYVPLRERYGGARLPSVEVVDMRAELRAGNTGEISRRLLDGLAETVGKREQAILFLNRRGYNASISCRSCGQPLTCPKCSVAMTYHKTRSHWLNDPRLVCHWCGTELPLPRACPSCGSEHLAPVGFGTERIEEELKLRIPDARILRMDADTTGTKRSYEEMLGKFRRHEADILLGTQMVTKGHDFPAVTLVGVLLADSSLYVNDYRANERTFAMLTQVIGRAGRADKPGRAVIQTNAPDNDVISLACEQDYGTFYEREIRLRRALCFPPICDIVLISFSGSAENMVGIAGVRLLEELKKLRAEPAFSSAELLVFGPVEAPVYRVDNRYRQRIVIKCRLTRQVLSLLQSLLLRVSSGFSKQKLYFSIDLNPSSL